MCGIAPEMGKKMLLAEEIAAGCNSLQLQQPLATVCDQRDHGEPSHVCLGQERATFPAQTCSTLLQLFISSLLHNARSWVSC